MINRVYLRDESEMFPLLSDLSSSCMLFSSYSYSSSSSNDSSRKSLDTLLKDVDLEFQ